MLGLPFWEQNHMAQGGPTYMGPRPEAGGAVITGSAAAASSIATYSYTYPATNGGMTAYTGSRWISGYSYQSIGATVTVDAGPWGGARNTFAYAWYRGTATVSNATSASYAIAAADRTTGFVTCKITGTNALGGKSSDAVLKIILP
jgi:hypothetical protein